MDEYFIFLQIIYFLFTKIKKVFTYIENALTKGVISLGILPVKLDEKIVLS